MGDTLLRREDAVGVEKLWAYIEDGRGARGHVGLPGGYRERLVEDGRILCGPPYAEDGTGALRLRDIVDEVVEEDIRIRWIACMTTLGY